jgi:hypothetical protein
MSTDRLGRQGGCVDVEGSLAELALGILPGNDRAVVLAHVQGCEHCQGELEKLTLTADGLLGLAPELEPPVGFEVELFRRLGIAEPHSGAQPAHRRIGGLLDRISSKGRVMVSAAAVTVAVALGFGSGWLANPGTSVSAVPSYEHGVASATATLTSDTHAVGTVSTFAGNPAWMLMTVHAGNVSGWVTCQVTVSGGQRVTVGSFRLDHGYGAWSARLPVSVPSIRSTQVTTSGGAAIGSATFAT